MRESLRTRVEEAGTPPRITIGSQAVHAAVALSRFYEQRTYRPAWSDDGVPASRIDALLGAIRSADREGLRPEDYHLAGIEALLGAVRGTRGTKTAADPRMLADLDLLLTDAFLLFGSHLLTGRVHPETIDPEWQANRREADFVEVLRTALAADEIAETLWSLLPNHPGYPPLRRALADYRQIAAGGGWCEVPPGPKMQKHDEGDRVAALRNRLLATRDLEPTESEGGRRFDRGLERAVRRFQERHGLDPDGVVGPATLEALNVPAEQRVRQIVLNMERWRWLPQDLGPVYVLINIASFELEVVEGYEPVLTMRVVVGRDYRRTPVFSDRMTYLVFNPHWHVPTSIAVQDMLPSIRKDPGYLAKNNFRVFRGWDAGTEPVDPKSVDWLAVTAHDFEYRFRQEPGPNNMLGRVKFMFPNGFNVYLHDTPARDLFAKTERAFSSGCIRVEKPLELAEYLLREDPNWTGERIRRVLETQIEQTVRLPRPVPIHVLYWTAWVDPDGGLQFRKDIYGRDRLLDEALKEEPPPPPNVEPLAPPPK